MLQQKFFTLEEANALVKRLKETFDKIADLRHDMSELQVRCDRLEEFWREELFAKDNPEGELYIFLKSHHGKLFSEVVKLIGDLENLGCSIKDVDEGLVDLPYSRNGEPVFLCWKYGESMIEHWHSITEGFAERKSIEELKV